MKKVSTKGSLREEEMRPEYDFSSMKRAVRGKYYKAYRSGHKVEIHQADGTTLVQYFKLEEGAVLLAPDVKKYFYLWKNISLLFLYSIFLRLFQAIGLNISIFTI